MRVKIIYDNDISVPLSELEYRIADFINQENIEVQSIHYSHAEITEDVRRESSCSFSVMIIYKDNREQ